MFAGQFHSFDVSQPTMPEADPELTWSLADAAPLELGGFPWYAEDGVFRRLPVHPPEPLPEGVEGLANSTAGGTLRLRTDSRRLALRVELAGRANMDHMPATGQCGFDLYVGAPGAERFARVVRYDHTQIDYEVELFSQPERAWRDLTLHFPLYQGVRRLEIGLEPGAELAAPAPRRITTPLVFYGTSITQGGCAARPGMAYPAILARRLQAECLNLGFSGNGRGEPEVARALALLPACALFVLDYDANCPDAEHLSRTLPVFIEILRQRHRDTPILVVSRIRSATEAWNPDAAAGRETRAAAQQQVVQRLGAAGDKRLFFLDGADLLGDGYDECTVDGSHPTDLGFLRMADSMEPLLRSILG